MPNLTGVTTNFYSTAQEGFTTTTSGSITSGATTVPLNSTSGYADGDVVTLTIEPASSTAKQVFTGIKNGLNIESVKWTEGTNQAHAAGSTVIDYVSATHQALQTKGNLVHTNPDGTLKANSVSTTTLADNSITTAKVNDNAITPGKISIPYKFSAKKDNSNGISSSGENVVFNVEEYDSGSNYNNTTGIFTAPAAGYYTFSTAVSINPSATSTRYIGIKKNGSEVKRGVRLDSSSLTTHVLSVDLLLAANDTVNVFGYSSVSTLNEANSLSNWFSGRIITIT